MPADFNPLQDHIIWARCGYDIRMTRDGVLCTVHCGASVIDEPWLMFLTLDSFLWHPIQPSSFVMIMRDVTGSEKNRCKRCS